MNGMSLMMSRPCCPIYKFGTNNKIDLLPRRLSNLHLQGNSPLVATTRMLKHRAYSLSALKDIVNGCSRSEVPKVSGFVVPFAFLGVGIIGFVLAKVWGSEVVAQSILTIGRIGVVVASIVAAHFLGNFLYAYTDILIDKPFSIGDTIEVGSLKGHVVKIGILSTTLLSTENVPVLAANTSFSNQTILNYPWFKMLSKIFVQVDEIDEIHNISREIIRMMKLNSNVYLERLRPYCNPSELEGSCAELTLGCHLKHMCEYKLLLAKQDILLQAALIIKKHGATLELMGK